MAKEIYLVSGPVALRPLADSDAEILLKWLTDPRVLEWYEGRDQTFTPERVREDFFGEEPGLRRCTIEYEGTPVGYVQLYPIDEEGFAEYEYSPAEKNLPGFLAFGVDQFIGEPDYWNRHIGRAFLRLLLNYLTTEEHVSAVILDPHVSNPRAIRCYEACGFRKLKLLPAHELHEGKMEDCWLMEYRP